MHWEEPGNDANAPVIMRANMMDGIANAPVMDATVVVVDGWNLVGGVHGTEAVRRMVRRMAGRGVDRIKIMATEWAGLQNGSPVLVFSES